MKMIFGTYPTWFEMLVSIRAVSCIVFYNDDIQNLKSASGRKYNSKSSSTVYIASIQTLSSVVLKSDLSTWSKKYWHKYDMHTNAELAISDGAIISRWKNK